MTINHSYVQVPNQTVKLDTVVMTIGSELVSRQIVALGDPENGLIQSFTGTSANVNITNAVDVNVSSMPLPTGAATLTEQQAQTTSLGTDGASPPIIVGTGVRGWLRGIYEKAVLLVSGLTDGTQRTKITDGTNNASVFSNKSLSVDDIYLAISRQEITNYASGNKAGHNQDVDIGSEDIIGQGGDYTPPTVARIHNIASSNANDTSAGTGAKTVSINGILADYTEANETITMNGTSNVATTNSYIFINRMRVETVGSVGTNVGVITATAQTDNTISAQIDTGYGQAALGVYLVPANKTMYLFKFGGSMIGSGSVGLRLMTRNFGGAWTIRNNLALNLNGTTHAERSYTMPLRITEKTYVKIRATASANNTDVSCFFDYLLIG